MKAGVVFHWDYIKWGQRVGVFIHGYTERQAVNYSAVVYPEYWALYPELARWISPKPHISLEHSDTYRHVDRTIARKVYITNNDPFYACSVDVLQNVAEF